jgi:hypothetical protein
MVLAAAPERKLDAIASSDINWAPYSASKIPKHWTIAGTWLANKALRKVPAEKTTTQYTDASCLPHPPDINGCRVNHVSFTQVACQTGVSSAVRLGSIRRYGTKQPGSSRNSSNRRVLMLCQIVLQIQCRALAAVLLLVGRCLFLAQAAFRCRLWNPRFLPWLRSRGNGQNEVPQFGQAIVDVFRLVSVALAGNDELSAVIDSLRITSHEAFANRLGQGSAFRDRPA